MSLPLRILLIVGAMLALAYILRKIRKCELEVGDSTFWIIFAFALVLIAIFPIIIIWPSELLGVDSPANFLFLVIIFVLICREFAATLQIARLKTQVKGLAQNRALREKRAAERRAREHRE